MLLRCVVAITVIVVSVNLVAKGSALTTGPLILNIVSKSVWVHGNSVTSERSLSGEAMSLDYLLDIAATAQRAARQTSQTLPVLRKSNKSLFCELAYKFARYSGCTNAEQRHLYSQVISLGHNDLYVITLSAIQLLTLEAQACKVPDNESLVMIIVNGVHELFNSQVELARYYHVLNQLKKLEKDYPEVAARVITRLSSRASRDLRAANVDFVQPNDPYYDLNLLADDALGIAPSKAVQFWCTMWKDSREKSGNP